MRRIFTFLVALLLLGTSSAWAAGYAINVKWTDFRTDAYTKMANFTSTQVWRYQFGSVLQIHPCCARYKSDNPYVYTIGGVDYMMPSKGSYTFTGTCKDMMMCSYQCSIDGTRVAGLYALSGTIFYIYSGNITVDEGADGPYIYCNNVGITDGESVYTKYSNGAITFKVGSSATYCNVTVGSANSTMGTASYTYKSGYVYADNRSKEFKMNSVYTLTATPKSGYRFVEWSDGNKNATRDITIKGKATYTATFEPLDSPKYTITTAANNPAYGSVTPATGEQYQNANVTLTATPKAGHKFIKWQKDGVDFGNTNPLTITVTKAETYTAVFEPFAAGTITAVANNAAMGTVTGGGNYAGNTNVTLTATAKTGYAFTRWSDGNTDNPRTIVVDGNASYTATFAVETPSYYAYKWGTDDIKTQKWGDNDFNSNWWDWIYEDCDFVRVDARNSSDKAVRLMFWVTDFSNTYNGKMGPAEGEYTIYEPDYNSTYYGWGISDSYLGSAVIGHNTASTIGNYTWGNVSAWSGNQPRYVSYMGNVTSFNTTTNCYGFTIGSKVKVAKGKDGNLYVEVRDPQGRLIVTIGEPAAPVTTHTITINPTTNGTLSVVDTDDNNKVITTGMEVAEGHHLTVTATPAEHYHFGAWTNDGAASIEVTGDKTIGATFAINTYTITLKNYDGTTWKTIENVVYNTMPTYEGTPTRTADAQYTYTFNTWSPALAVATANAEYTATYNTTTNKYDITFVVEGQEDVVKNLEYGATPSYGAEDPTKEATGQYSYLFSGWSPAIASVTGEATYTAQFTPELRQYTITFKNGETTLQSGLVDYGVMPTYNGETPTKDEDAQYTYTFDGWGEAVVAVSGNKTYQAHFAETTRQYTINLPAATNGTVVVKNAETVVNDGDKVDYGTTLTVTATPATGYHFVEWTNSSITTTSEQGVVPVVGTITISSDATLGATFESNKFMLYDDKNEGDPFYTKYANLVGTEGQTVTYVRTFQEGWSVFSLPFDFSLMKNKTHVFAGKVLSLDKATYSEEGYLSLFFTPVSRKIEANTPYILYTTSTIVNPEFENVTLKTLEQTTTTIALTAEETGFQSGTIDFINTIYRQALPENKNTIYMSANKLYYPAKTIYMRAFRGYFNLATDIKHVSVRIMVDGEDVNVKTEDESQLQETKKYFENDILVIERNGKKYNVQGTLLE